MLERLVVKGRPWRSRGLKLGLPMNSATTSVTPAPGTSLSHKGAGLMGTHAQPSPIGRP